MTQLELFGPAAMCEGFAWIGQSFKYCDSCGDAFWNHEFELKPGSPFGTFRKDPISPELAAAVKRKWDRE